RIVASERHGDRGLDPLAGYISDLLIEELRRIGAAGALEIAAFQPLAGDRLELPEEMQLRRFARIAVLLIEKALGQMEQDGRAAHVVEVLDRQVNALADDALVLGNGRPDKGRRQLEHRVLVEAGGELLVRQLDAITLD